MVDNNSSHLLNERRGFYYVFKKLGIKAALFLIFLINFFIILYNIDTVHSTSWYEFFFEFKNKKSLNTVELQPGYTCFYLIYFIWVLCTSILEDNILSYVISFLVGSYALIFIDKVVKFLEVEISYIFILLVLIIFSISKLITSYFRLYYYILSSPNQITTISDKCVDLMAEHFDYVAVERIYWGTNCFNGPIGYKQCIVFLGDTSFLTEDEIYAIILHEIGHGGNLGVHKCFIINLIIYFSVLSFFYLMCKWYCEEFFDGARSLTLFLLICFLPVINEVNSILTHLHNIRVEFISDDYATKLNYGEHLMKGLIKLAYKNYSVTKLNFFTNFLIYTHPCDYLRCVNYESKVKNK